MDAAVQPAKLRFALGIDVVINIQNLSAEIAVLIEEFEKILKSLPACGGDAQHRRAGVMLLEQAAKLP